MWSPLGLTAERHLWSAGGLVPSSMARMPRYHPCMSLLDVSPWPDQLDAADRRALAEHLWASIGESELAISPSELRLVDEAHKRFLAEPGEGLDWADVERELDADFGPAQ